MATKKINNFTYTIVVCLVAMLVWQAYYPRLAWTQVTEQPEIEVIEESNLNDNWLSTGTETYLNPELWNNLDFPSYKNNLSLINNVSPARPYLNLPIFVELLQNLLVTQAKPPVNSNYDYLLLRVQELYRFSMVEQSQLILDNIPDYIKNRYMWRLVVENHLLNSRFKQVCTLTTEVDYANYLNKSDRLLHDKLNILCLLLEGKTTQVLTLAEWLAENDPDDSLFYQLILELSEPSETQEYTIDLNTHNLNIIHWAMLKLGKFSIKNVNAGISRNHLLLAYQTIRSANVSIEERQIMAEHLLQRGIIKELPKIRQVYALLYQQIIDQDDFNPENLQYNNKWRAYYYGKIVFAESLKEKMELLAYTLQTVQNKNDFYWYLWLFQDLLISISTEEQMDNLQKENIKTAGVSVHISRAFFHMGQENFARQWIKIMSDDERKEVALLDWLANGCPILPSQTISDKLHDSLSKVHQRESASGSSQQAVFQFQQIQIQIALVLALNNFATTQCLQGRLLSPEWYRSGLTLDAHMTNYYYTLPLSYVTSLEKSVTDGHLGNALMNILYQGQLAVLHKQSLAPRHVQQITEWLGYLNLTTQARDFAVQYSVFMGL